MLTPLTLLFALGSLAPPQSDAPSVRSVERSGDGQPACGLGKAFHAGRRKLLRERLKEGVLVVRGLPETRDYVRFHQDKVFWYLTGVESPEAAFAMDCASGREVLLLPQKSPMGESWEGEKWDSQDAWVRGLTGIQEVRSARELEVVLKEMLEGTKKAWISKHPHVALSGGYDRAGPYDRRMEKDPFDGRKSREETLEQALKSRLEVEVADAAPEITKLRLVKTPEEVGALRRAARSAALAMAEAIRSTRPGLGEWEVEALMSFVQVREGAVGPGYHGIVGSGPNSLVLHYSASSRRMRAGEVLLVDYAPEVDHLVSDVTRTWPVGGSFTARQAELYDAVLAAQEAGIAAVKPGAPWSAVQKACDRVIEERGLGALRRHGVSHWIGMEVHDPGPMGEVKLEPGMAFTVEPGLYEPETAIGIRIEDVVVVTEKGCDVISADVPRRREEVEKLWREKGLLDLLEKARD